MRFELVIRLERATGECVQEWTIPAPINSNAADPLILIAIRRPAAYTPSVVARSVISAYPRTEDA